MEQYEKDRWRDWAIFTVIVVILLLWGLSHVLKGG